MSELPVLIVGDVHGDLERLFTALKPYPPQEWRTIFLGDLVDGGPFGVGALRYARDRPNSTVLLGNHEVAMLRALRDPESIGGWLSVGGELHDLEELRKDPTLQAWLLDRPALLMLDDGTIVEHSDNDGYWELAGSGDPKVVNATIRELLAEPGREAELWAALSPRSIFKRPGRLQRWLERTGAERVVHGHTPHSAAKPEVYGGGRAINFDGGLSRFGRPRYRRLAPVQASVGPLGARGRGSLDLRPHG